jgi:cytochrome c55X
MIPDARSNDPLPGVSFPKIGAPTFPPPLWGRTGCERLRTAGAETGRSFVGSVLFRRGSFACSALVATVAAVALLVASPTSAARSEPDAAAKARLTHLLVQDCGSCHGLTLQGGLGKPLLPEDVSDRSVEVLAEIILDGIPGTPMPPWRGLVTPEEARFLAETLKQGVPR